LAEATFDAEEAFVVDDDSVVLVVKHENYIKII